MFLGKKSEEMKIMEVLMWSIYEIIHIWAAVVDDVKNDHRSREKAWKNQGFNRNRTCDLCDTGEMLYQLSYEATHWEGGQLSS